MRPLVAVLILTLALGGGLVALTATNSLPWVGEGASIDERGTPSAEGADRSPEGERSRANRFDERRAFAHLERQVELGPRPAGSPASRRLASRLRRELPRSRYQSVPGGLRNVIGEVPGRDPDRVVVVGAHYDTKDAPGFLGANDGASGTAVVVELARVVEPRELGPTVVFILFDGEETPAGTLDAALADAGLRGSKAAAPRYEDAEAMILADLVGDRDLSIPREARSDPELWGRLREAAGRAGHLAAFPPAERGGIIDDHVPFQEVGVPAIDVIDLDFACFHRRCDDLGAVSPRSLDAVGETLLELLRRL